LRARRRGAGLEIQNGVATAGEVGAADESENPIPGFNRQFAADFRVSRRDVGAAPGFEIFKPARDAFITRPPECARLRKILERREMPFAEAQKFAIRIIRQCVGIGLGKVADGAMDDTAALCRSGPVINRVEGRRRNIAA
jgi:hypothetical protein